MQGVGAAIAGAVAERTSPATATALLAVASIGVTLALAPGLRPAGNPAASGGGAVPPSEDADLLEA